MSTPDPSPEARQANSNKIRGVVTLVILACAAAAGGCYFAVVLK